MDKAPIVREIALVYAAMVAVTLIVTYAPSTLAQQYGHLALAASFLFTALHRARKDPRGVPYYGIDLSGVLEPSEEERAGEAGLTRTIVRALPRLASELGVALLTALIVFPPFVLAFRLWHGVTQPFTWQPPRDLLDFVLSQLVVVALPEEALFRGYFQTRLRDVFPRTVRLLGTELSPMALGCQAVLFALLHFLVGLLPARLAVFFPGLLFGYLRARRRGIGAALWFHAMCNLLSEILTRGYL